MRRWLLPLPVLLRLALTLLRLAVVGLGVGWLVWHCPNARPLADELLAAPARP